MYNDQFTKDNYTKYLIEDLNPIWPELREYANTIHAIYAGLDPEFSFNIQSFNSIVNQIIEAVNKGKTRIIFTNMDEDFIESIVTKIHEIIHYLSQFNLPCEYYHLTGAFNTESNYNYILDKYRFTEKLNILELSYPQYCFRRDGLFREHTIPDYTVKIKEKIFLSFNNVPRPHRIELLDHMFNENLVAKSYYSFYTSSDNIDDNFRYIKHNGDKLPLLLNKENKTNLASIAYDDIPYFTNSYFSLVTETFFDYKEPDSTSIFMTEKTYKPIALRHPFIIVGKPYVLKTLKELGFKTFSPYIDESYDEIKDNRQRMNVIIKEIIRLSKFTTDEWLSWQENIRDIVNHNHSFFMDSNTYTLQKFSDYA